MNSGHRFPKSMYPKMEAELGGARVRAGERPPPERGPGATKPPGANAGGAAEDRFLRAMVELGLPREKAEPLLAAHRRAVTSAVAQARRGGRNSRR
ncbi:hypothetical protein A2cp1_3430 [Anaeromyxobacter dehalogenans 2CP-1]|uniref:Uncharacterized protein n=1 Tax=Anaeromyxobacter dehalogenans (strain ATCC BAA-258 / DSM 21875 / 2CP-1) TaxID=455488 RepID=B8JHP8_ANAD2|nr:hypothetical protein [Anaeromyxobacter dehalogenans]ACL66760.1 hypothetical protein A2cp1_3430 [Anaeromyxobacter dehalogenans 2CP-1]